MQIIFIERKLHADERDEMGRWGALASIVKTRLNLCCGLEEPYLKI